jgi:uncharacterized membrane protein YfcA
MDIIPNLLLIGLGFLVGTFGTLIGAGGGFILVPVLLFIYPSLKPEVVTSISLAVVFLNAASGSYAYAKLKRIDYKSAIIFAIATLPGSIIGALVTSHLPRHIFNLILGILLIIVAIYLLVRPEDNFKGQNNSDSYLVERTIIDVYKERYSYSFNQVIGIVISFFVGFLSSLLGIGGGIIHVPALASLLNFPVHIATATSHFILAVMALAGTIVHMIQGTFWQEWTKAVFIGIGVIGGAQVGARLSERVKPKGIIWALAAALFLVGIRLLFF